MISWLCTVWTTYPPPDKFHLFIPWSGSAAAQSLLPVGERGEDYKLGMHVHRCILGRCFLMVMDRDDLSRSMTLSFLALASIRVDQADGMMNSKMYFVRMPPADTKQKNMNVASSFLSLKSIRTPQIMWRCTKLQWQAQEHCSRNWNGLTSVIIAPFPLL